MLDVIRAPKTKQEIFKKKHPGASFEDASDRISERFAVTFECESPDDEYLRWLEEENLQGLSFYYQMTKNDPVLKHTLTRKTRADIPATPAYPR